MGRPLRRSMLIRLCEDERELIHTALFEYVYYAHYSDEREKELALKAKEKIEHTLENERGRARG